jgi:hypothetical protein
MKGAGASRALTIEKPLHARIRSRSAIGPPCLNTGPPGFCWLVGNQDMGHAARVTRRMVAMLRS